jgi:integrase
MKRRTRIAEGVYRDRYGLAATVKVGRVQKEQRFPNDTDLDTIKSWRTQTRAELDEDRDDEPPARRGTLKDEAERYIVQILGKGSHEASHLRAWYPRFGGLLLSRITRLAIQRQIDLWRGAGIAARTLRHRCRLLRKLYRGRRTPADRLTLPPVPPPRPIAVPLETIRRVAANLAASRSTKTRARFLIRATTGQRPSQIGRAKAEDIDIERRLWFVRSAKGGHAIPFPLNDEAIRAWQLFAQVDAWGPFSTKKHARLLREYGWPAGVRPYALRSTFAIDLLLSGADLGDVQGLLGHAHIETTRKHYAPVLVARLQAVTAGRTLGVLPAESCQPTTRNRSERSGKPRKPKRGGAPQTMKQTA